MALQFPLEFLPAHRTGGRDLGDHERVAAEGPCRADFGELPYAVERRGHDRHGGDGDHDGEHAEPRAQRVGAQRADGLRHLRVRHSLQQETRRRHEAASREHALRPDILT